MDAIGSENFLTCGFDRQIILWKVNTYNIFIKIGDFNYYFFKIKKIISKKLKKYYF